MSEFYDVFTKTTFTDFIRKNKEVEFAKDDKEYGGKWIKDFLGNHVFAYVRDDTDEILGLKRHAGNTALLIIYLLIVRENALVMTEYDPMFYDGPIKDGISDPYENYYASTASFLSYILESENCKDWLKALPDGNICHT